MRSKMGRNREKKTLKEQSKGEKKKKEELRIRKTK